MARECMEGLEADPIQQTDALSPLNTLRTRGSFPFSVLRRYNLVNAVPKPHGEKARRVPRTATATPPSSRQLLGELLITQNAPQS